MFTLRFRSSVFAAVALLVATGLASAYTPPSPIQKTTNKAQPWSLVPTSVMAATATAALSVLLATTEPAMAMSKTAAQIQVNSIPPTSIEVNIKDLPLVGDLLSGTYTKVSDGSTIKNPSVIIQSPKDKVSAIKSAATNGHLEFDTNGLLATHLDIDIAADEAGIAKVRIASPLIPQLPFKNPAANSPSSFKPTGKESEWFAVTNLGSGETYYYSDKSGDTTYQKPRGF